MNGVRRELVLGPLRAMRRAIFWWSAALASLVLVTIIFWPVFKGSTGITDALNHLPPSILTAFGLADFGSPAGFLRANLYEILVPILLIAATVTLVGSQTAGEEAAGRLELYLAQPIGRRAIFAGRLVAAFIGLAIISLTLAIVQVAIDTLVDLPIDLGYLLSTIALCAALALFYGSLAFLIACLRPKFSLVLGAGIELAVASYLVVALFSFSPALSPWSQLSPWSWAFGGNSLEHATELWRYSALLLPALALILGGLRAMTRRDIVAG